MAGGAPADNAVITRKILEGEKGPRRDVVVVNAGAALMAAGVAGDLPEGIRLAGNAIDDGRAMGKLNELVRFTNDNG
jgi:anthranilate phosphoribosyltransferase